MPNSADLLRSYLDILNEQPVQSPPAAPQAAAPAPQAAVPAPAPKTVAQKVKQGVASVGKALGAKGGGATAAAGLDKISQGQGVSGNQADAIKPFIEPLQRILADPMLKQKFMALVQASRPKQQ